ncbi:unnamed protein product [Rodentolepis nana]|uniref:Dynein heavy chain 1, axonemal n=1 Tax=Rodentolepis nana TaxID=102285 RepID=A0A0R3T7D8_RODNA|nr:unnamed protein product [Rodentolepis nana]
MVAGASERPQGRGTREKGKGWQRSKSSTYDYGSDFYFSEEKANRQRRAQSSMSGRRTDKNSSFYDIGKFTTPCGPARQPRKRRASVEAVVKSARPDAVMTQPPINVGPPIQKRFQTVKEIEGRDALTPNKAIVGHTDISRDKNFQKPLVVDREGPKARSYTPKYETLGAEPIFFPLEEPEHDKRTYAPKYRLMEMLVTTETFKERLRDRAEEDLSFATSDTQPWEVYSSWTIEPNHEYINELRIELRQSEVQENRIIPGRVFFSLKKPATIDSIHIDINKTLAKTTPKGDVFVKPLDERGITPELKLLPNRRPALNILDDENAPSSSTQEPPRSIPSDFDLIETVPKRITLPAGANEVKFDLFVPENQVPSFIYASLDGKTVINNYSAEAAVRIGNNLERTGRVPIKVPALGERNIGYADRDNNYDLLLFNKYFNDTEGFDYSVGYNKQEGGYDKPKKVHATVIRIVRCPQIGLNDRTTVADLGSTKDTSSKSNEVLRKFQDNLKTQPLVPKTEWDSSHYDLDNYISSTTPSVAVDDFSCTYYIEILADGERYVGPIIKCDRLVDRPIVRNDIGPSAMRNDFKIII